MSCSGSGGRLAWILTLGRYVCHCPPNTERKSWTVPSGDFSDTQRCIQSLKSHLVPGTTLILSRVQHRKKEQQNAIGNVVSKIDIALATRTAASAASQTIIKIEDVGNFEGQHKTGSWLTAYSGRARHVHSIGEQHSLMQCRALRSSMLCWRWI